MTRRIIVCLIVAFSWVAGGADLKTRKTGSSPKKRKSSVVAGSIVRAAQSDENLVKPIEAMRKGKPMKNCKIADFSHIVRPVSKKYGVDWKLVTAVMAAESSFNPCATSPVGAVGLMQLMPATAKDYKVKETELYQPEKNIVAGVQHLRRLNTVFKSNLSLTVAAYNAGEGAVQKFKGIPPFKETQDYVKKVLAYRNQLKRAPAQSGAPLLASIRTAAVPRMAAR